MGQGVFKSLFRNQEARILMNGLDAAGKTTILYRLKLGEVVSTIPTIGFNVETVEHRGINITAWDVGGRGKMRPLLRHYYANTDAILYIVDSSDHERIEEAKDELHRMVVEDELLDAVIVLLANKQDLPNALTVSEVNKAMEFDAIQKTHRAASFGCCAVIGDGLYEALDFLAEQLSAPSPRKTSLTQESVKKTTWSFSAYVKETFKTLLSRTS